MIVPSRELTLEDQELIEFARQIVDANTDGEDGVHTMGVAPSDPAAATARCYSTITRGSGPSCPLPMASEACGSCSLLGFWDRESYPA
jgi:hypothetical protein